MAPLDVLKQYWGYDGFREPQAAIIDHVLAGKDAVALLPTGGGKSLCYQVPALCVPGMVLVISPLIALMKDQVERLHRLSIPAAYVNSSMNQQEVDHHLQAAMDGAYKLLYVSPERLQTEMFRLRVPRMNLSLLAVDEAHCISQWGYDFRPPYLDIASIRDIFPDLPVIALTASATPKVEADILANLRLQNPEIFRKSFARANLRYFVLKEENVAERLLTICQRTLGTGIVYARTRKLTLALADYLKRGGIPAAAYHGGMPTADRDAVQQAWLEGTYRVMVATNAFGMGIDKPDVRFVIHHNIPFDLESYYQEAGRAGRDGHTALAIAFNNPPDLAEARRWVALRYPAWKVVEAVYDALHRQFNIPHTGTVFSQVPFDLGAFATMLELPVMTVYQALRLLDREAMIQYEEEPDSYGYLRIKASPREVLHYRKKHSRAGAVLEHALRNLGGEAYHYQQRFVPGRWAELLGLSMETLQEQLNTLSRAGLIYYQPPRREPRITFFQPRKRLSRQLLNWEKYVFLEQRAKARFEAMEAYCIREDTCRSMRIQEYFGESGGKDCGVCDVCIARKKRASGSGKGIRENILAVIRAQPGISYREIIRAVHTGDADQREATLRLLLDEGVIRADETGKVFIRDYDA